MSDPIVILTEEPLGADDRVNIDRLLAGGDAPLVVLVPASTERHSWEQRLGFWGREYLARHLAYLDVYTTLRFVRDEGESLIRTVNAEGEFQAAEKMVQAASMIAKEPIALQLRYLQTMREMASEHNTTTFLPVPIDLFSPFMKGPPKA